MLDMIYSYIDYNYQPFKRYYSNKKCFYGNIAVMTKKMKYQQLK